MTERLDRVETDIVEIKRAISELRSTVATLADVAGIHDRQIEQLIQTQGQLIQSQQESSQRFNQFVERSEQDRALMLQLIQQLAQGRNGGN
jgi:ABC-type transporter Mla subunit MlaD